MSNLSTPTDPLPTHSPIPIPVYTTVPPIRALRHASTLANQTIGFIPTMGALHNGHLSLILHAAHHHPVLIVSIFINPAQFAPHEDLSVYPRTLEADLSALHSLNAQLDLQDPSGTTLGRIRAVFHPDTSVLYPRGIPLDQSSQRGAFVTVHPLSSKLEGVTRPHFFRGVATVCTKLFNIVQPDAAYFGQKDVQQTIVLKTLVEDLHFPIKIAVCPTARESSDGLALSSRNVYLGPVRRTYAGCLYAALSAARKTYEEGLSKGGVEAKEILLSATMVLRNYVTEGKIEIEYLSLADGRELEEFGPDEKIGVETGEGAVLSGAIRMLPREEGQGIVRLIDNLIL
ncbi:hypothetical protein BDZ91DRAFT_730803 [Kalaharituber pfeilii]|nr:hypothetical protein BDZ91DRAFT_730803 [Kalaharituber pfeilii]